MDLLEIDVEIMHLMNHALVLACRVVQDLATRQFVVLPSVGGSVQFAHVAAARSWLREYAFCGMYARRCFQDGNHVCRSFEEVASQCDCSTPTSL
jgi:hypothetical protein